MTREQVIALQQEAARASERARMALELYQAPPSVGRDVASTFVGLELPTRGMRNAGDLALAALAGFAIGGAVFGRGSKR